MYKLKKTCLTDPLGVNFVLFWEDVLEINQKADNVYEIVYTLSEYKNEPLTLKDGTVTCQLIPIGNLKEHKCLVCDDYVYICKQLGFNDETILN